MRTGIGAYGYASFNEYCRPEEKNEDLGCLSLGGVMINPVTGLEVTIHRA